MTAETAQDRPASGRGGRRPRAGRKRKGHVAPTALGEIDIKAALAAAVPERIEDVAAGDAHASLEALVKQLLAGASEFVKVRAANAILDRGFGKPAVEAGGEPTLPFFGIAPQAKLHGEIREAARRHANLAIAALRRIRDHGESESARIAAAQALLDRGLGTVATAKVPDGPVARPLGKKEEASAAARDAASGRYATPPAPRLQ